MVDVRADWEELSLRLLSIHIQIHEDFGIQRLGGLVKIMELVNSNVASELWPQTPRWKWRQARVQGAIGKAEDEQAGLSENPSWNRVTKSFRGASRQRATWAPSRGGRCGCSEIHRWAQGTWRLRSQWPHGVCKELRFYFECMGSLLRRVLKQSLDLC